MLPSKFFFCHEIVSSSSRMYWCCDCVDDFGLGWLGNASS